MVTGCDVYGFIFNAFFESFNTCSSWFFVVVEILGMSSGLVGISDKMSSGFVIFGKFKMALGHRSLNSVVYTNKYNQLLKTKWNLS